MKQNKIKLNKNKYNDIYIKKIVKQLKENKRYQME